MFYFNFISIEFYYYHGFTRPISVHSGTWTGCKQTGSEMVDSEFDDKIVHEIYDNDLM